jgi:mannose-6-phosphate isomerase-like protein (cupin superfamily)
VVENQALEYCMRSSEGEESADGVETRPLFGRACGCRTFEQRLLRFSAGSSPRLDPDRDEVLYVLSGSGSATMGDGAASLAPGTAVFVARGTTWQVDEGADLELLSVLVHDPLPGASPHAVVDAEGQEAGDATAGRMFRLLAGPGVGCASVTQFVGMIPVVRAPDHFHRYDEVVYVLQGRGALHIGGGSVAVEAGTAIHFPSGLVHCLENTGPGEMQILGVFRPAGSPAEAYYPDGTPAEY